MPEVRSAVDLLAIAYELASSSLRTSQVPAELVVCHRNLSAAEFSHIMINVIQLRAPDDEFLVDDRVVFTHWDSGERYIGTVVSLSWYDTHQSIGVKTDHNGEIYQTWAHRCMHL